MYFSRIRIRPEVRDLHLLMSGNGYGSHQLLWKLFSNSGEGRTFLFREEIAREQIPFHKGVRGEPIFYVVSATLPIANHPVFSVESKEYAPQLQEGERLAFRLRANPVQLAKKERTFEELDAWRKSRAARGLAPTKSMERGRTEKIIRHDVVMDAQYHLLRDLARKMDTRLEGDKSQIKKHLLTALQQTSNPNPMEDELRGIILENERFEELANISMPPAKLLDTAVKSRMNKALETWLCEKGERLGFALVRDQFRQRLKFQAEAYQWHSLPKKGRDAGFSSVDFEGEVEVVDAELFGKALCEGIGPAKGFGCGLMLVRRV